MDINLNRDLNSRFIPMFQSVNPELIVYGGTGAGKSYTIAQKIIINMLTGYAKKVVVIRKTRPALYDTCYSLIKELLDKYKLPYTAKDQKMEINLSGGVIHFLPIVNTNTRGDPASRLKSLKGVDILWVEEPTEITEDEYLKLPNMLQGEKKEKRLKQVILSFNPIDQNHWIKKFFFDKNRGDRQKYTYKDNPFLDDLSRARIEEYKDVNENMYRIYALGEWGTTEDVIYSNYQVEAFGYPITYYDDVFGGLDFGWEHPQVFVLMGIKENDLYIIDTIYRTHTKNEDFGYLIKDKIEKYDLHPNLEIYCDHEPEFIDELYNLGLNVYPANKKVEAGIREVLKYKQHIHERNVAFVKEIQGYRRKKDKNDITLEEPVKINDDGMDAMRYGVFSRARRVTNAIV